MNPYSYQDCVWMSRQDEDEPQSPLRQVHPWPKGDLKNEDSLYRAVLNCATGAELQWWEWSQHKPTSISTLYSWIAWMWLTHRKGLIGLSCTTRSLLRPFASETKINTHTIDTRKLRFNWDSSSRMISIHSFPDVISLGHKEASPYVK